MVFLEVAAKQVSRLTKSDRERVEKAIEARAQNPDVPSARLHGDWVGHYKIKLQSIGLRVIYRIDHKVVTVIVVAVGQRANDDIYRRPK